MSKCDETHLGMNPSPFISLFSGIHSQRLMERADKGGGCRYELYEGGNRGMRKRRTDEYKREGRMKWRAEGCRGQRYAGRTELNNRGQKEIWIRTGKMEKGG